MRCVLRGIFQQLNVCGCWWFWSLFLNRLMLHYYWLLLLFLLLWISSSVFKITLSFTLMSYEFCLYLLFLWFGVSSKLVSADISVELARHESSWQGQAIIPDLCVFLPVGGQATQVLLELKCISICLSHYKPSWKDRGVDGRAGQLHKKYVRKARDVDRVSIGTAPGKLGPVEAKLLGLKQQ